MGAEMKIIDQLKVALSRAKVSQPEQEKAPSSRTATSELLWDLGNTAKARFIAAKRLEATDRALTRLTALTSAYLIVLTAVPYFLELPERVTDHINLLAISLAVVILVSSLLQYSSSAVANAEQHHRSGLEINEIFRELELKSAASTPADLEIFQERYHRVLQKYSINHDKIDYWQVQLERPQDYPWLSKSQKRKRARGIFLARSWPDLAMVAVTLLWLAVILVYAFPRELPG
jgi:hypothetical protein